MATPEVSLAGESSIGFPSKRASFLCLSLEVRPYPQELSQLGDI